MQNNFVNKQGFFSHGMHQITTTKMKMIITFLSKHSQTLCHVTETKLIPFIYHNNCIRCSIFPKCLKLFKLPGYLNTQQERAFK
jgi:hypothetical protein